MFFVRIRLPQGAVISVTLFLLPINNIVKNVNFPVKSLLYSDDLVIYTENRNPNEVV